MPTVTRDHAQVRRPACPRFVDEAIAEMYQRVGLDDRAATIRRVLDQCESLNTDTTALTNDLNKVVVDRVLAVCYGGVSLPDAAVAIHHARNIEAARPIVAELAALVTTQLHHDAAKAMWSESDGLIHELDRVVQSSVAEIVAAAALIGGITDDSGSVRAEPKAQRAWSVAVTATERVTLAQQLSSMLRVAEYVPTIREAGDRDWAYRDPRLVVDDRSAHPVLVMLADIEAGARPCCATADEIYAATYAAT